VHGSYEPLRSAGSRGSTGRRAWPRRHVYYEIATRPEVLDVVAELLGGPVILWGASIQHRAPNEAHPWHSDIESSDPESRTVSVWIGLENTTPESSLQVLPYSHRFGVTVQQLRQENGKQRDETSVEDLTVRAWPGRCAPHGGAPSLPSQATACRGTS
jgi:ectoine hydroxylase-related dioxygenase (phytanoyl-CoA dioxygenase family)